MRFELGHLEGGGKDLSQALFQGDPKLLGQTHVKLNTCRSPLQHLGKPQPQDACQLECR